VFKKMLNSYTYLFFVLHGGSEEGGVAEDVKHILACRDEDGFTLADVDAVDVGLPP
jgi:hypothetical protein